MKVRTNKHTREIIYLRGETAEERRVLEDMWNHGVVACSGGSELGVCSAKFFGSEEQDFHGLESETKGGDNG